MEEREEVKEEKETLLNKVDLEKIKKNPWIVSTAVFAIISIILLVMVLRSGGITGNVISVDSAGNQVTNFVSNVYGVDLTYQSGEESNGIYVLTYDMEGQPIQMGSTKDFSFIMLPTGSWVRVADFEDISYEEPEEEVVEKLDVPVVDLFIWGYCPYGVQAQEPFAEVASLLGDSAEFNVWMYYDGHGEYETQQNKIQECIQEIDKDKYWSYAAGFVSGIYPKCGSSKDIECDKTESVKLMNSLGIDSNLVLSCVESQGEALIEGASDFAQQLGVTGSPTIVINGVKMNVARTSEAIKQAVCDAFNTQPAECEQELDSTNTAASGSC